MSEDQAGAAVAEAPPVEKAVEVEQPKVEEKKEAPAPKTYTQEEMDRITAKVKKNAKYAGKKEAEAYYRGLREGGGEQRQPKQEPAEEKEPTRDQFDTYEGFIEARADYRARKASREENTKIKSEEQAKSAHESRVKTFSKFQTAMREKFPDVDERCEEVADTEMYLAVQDAIAESPLGPEIFNELLSKGSEEFARLRAMSASAAVKEIGRLEARLEAKAPKAEEKKEQPKLASKAPPPIAPPSGEPAASDDMPSDKDDINSWMAKENKRGLKLMKQG